MIRSLYSGVLGMKNHQIRMDVIGNNIANVNTTGYKASRANFQDVMYQMVKQGGINSNPAQAGIGINVASINTDMTPGGLQPTSRTLDLGISGSGFFKVVNGGTEYYTREGIFYLTRNGDIVNSSGYTIKGETWNKAKSEVTIADPDAAIVTKASGETDVGGTTGNITVVTTANGTDLNGYTITFDNTIDQANGSVDTTTKTIIVGTQDAADTAAGVTAAINTAIATEASLNGIAVETINYDGTGFAKADLAGNNVGLYTNRATGTSDSGTAITGNITVTTTTGGTELNGYTITFDNTIDQANGSVDTTTKTIIVGTQDVADTAAGVTAAINTAIATEASLNGITVGTIINDGTGFAKADLDGDSVSLLAGKSLSLQGVLANGTKVATPVVVDLTSSNDLSLDQVIDKINAEQEESGVKAYKYTDDNGDIKLVLTTVYNGYDEKYESEVALEIISKGFDAASDPNLDTTAFLSGYTPNVDISIQNIPVADLTIQNDGTISGTDTDNVPLMFSNGTDAARVSLYTFKNQDGLERFKDNLYQESASSGSGQMGVAGSNGFGTIESGYLEMSNVNLTDEFSNMITTQRGYQANSRIITVSDTMLEELLNLKR